MECAVCYSEVGPFQNLCCGHTFCTGCVKQWYLKGTGTGCPMCRRPIYFKGFHKVREQWDEDAWENRCADALAEAFDGVFAEAQEMAQMFPEEFRAEIMAEVIDDMVDLEKTFRFLKAENIASEDIAYVLMDTMDYYSDRHLNKVRWLDEPTKEWVSRYSGRGGSSGAKGSKRCRARPDEWVTLSFYVEL